MDWSDPSVRFGSSALNVALKKFCDAALRCIHRRVLELLDSLRACRVTLEYLRKVHSVDVVSRQMLAKHEAPPSVMTPLDDKSTNRVKGYLRRRVEKLRFSHAEEYRELVPQDRNAFESGFDAFVEKCMEHRTGFQDAWFEQHVSSGAAQPQLWKIYVAFQRQLRGACEARSKAPLPPPLFMKQDQHRRTATQNLEPVEMPTHRGHTQSCTDFLRMPLHPYPINGLVSLPCVPYHFALDAHGYANNNQGAWFAPKNLQDDSGISYPRYEPVLLPVCFQYSAPFMYSKKPHAGDF